MGIPEFIGEDQVNGSGIAMRPAVGCIGEDDVTKHMARQNRPISRNDKVASGPSESGKAPALSVGQVPIAADVVQKPAESPTRPPAPKKG